MMQRDPQKPLRRPNVPAPVLVDARDQFRGRGPKLPTPDPQRVPGFAVINIHDADPLYSVSPSEQGTPLRKRSFLQQQARPSVSTAEDPPVKVAVSSSLEQMFASTMDPQADVLARSDAHPIRLAEILNGWFGPLEWTQKWEPKTIKAEVLRRAPQMSQSSWDKIMAAKLLTASRRPWADPDVFDKVAAAFNGSPIAFDQILYVSPAQAAFAVTIMNHLTDGLPPDERPVFGDDVATYIAASGVNDGMVYLPPPIDFAQEAMSKWHEDSSLANEVQKTWLPMASLPLEACAELVRAEVRDVIRNQLVQVLSIRAYLEERAKGLEG